MRFCIAIVAALASTFVPWSARATVLDPLFTEVLFADVGNSTTGMAWAPDGSNRLFVLTKNGSVRIIKNGSLLPAPFSTDAVFTSSECGLIGIAFDPNFIQNGFVYLFETVSASEQQIIRYTATGDIGGTRTPIVTGLPTVGANHDGGGIGFGPDGKLYWSIGDLGNGTGTNSDLTSLASKVGRANRNGTLPLGNPFDDGAGPNNDYIWARGFRNPFTLAFQPGTGSLWVNVAGTAYEQIFVVASGNHAGYNTFENNQPAGFIPPAVVYRTNGTDARSISASSGAVRSGGVSTYTTSLAHGFRKGSKIAVSGVSDPTFNTTGFVLATPSATTFTFTQPGPNSVSGGGAATTLQIGGSVTGGAFWSSSSVPAAYRGNFFFTDFNSARVERVTLASDNTVMSVDHFASNEQSAIDAAVGPDGALYILQFAGPVTRVSYNSPSQALVVTPLDVRMDEGGRAAVSVRLAVAPTGNVTITGAVGSGDADVSISGGNTRTFTPANWSVPQTFQVQALTDADGAEDFTRLTFSSLPLASENVDVRVTDLAAAVAVPALAPQRLALLSVVLLGGGLLLVSRRRK